MGNAKLPNCYHFPYLGVQYCGDGNTRFNLETRQAIAASRFRSLMDIWKDKRLKETLKLRLYHSLVISIYTYGKHAWILDRATLRKVNGFNSRCLSVITGREIREEAKDPTWDLCANLRSSRLEHLGHILRSGSDNLVRLSVTARGTNHRDGDLFMDAPDHASIDELTEIAFNRSEWRSMVHQLKGEGSHQTVLANTAAETEALINQLPDGSILAYTDGGCDGNGAGGKWGAAGWGAWIATKTDSGATAIADLWGPVVTDNQSEFYQQCEIGSNNTGELTGMLQALLWARNQNGHEPLAICYDSMYAANLTAGITKAKANKGVAKLCRDAFIEESARREGGITMIHGKGHSDQIGNEKADERVQWGKESGPYCRFRLDGTTEGDNIFEPRALPSAKSLAHPSPSLKLRHSAQSSLRPYPTRTGRRSLDESTTNPVPRQRDAARRTLNFNEPTNQPTNNAKTTRSGLFSPGARTSSTTVDIPKPIAETTSVKDTPSTERQPNPPDHRHLWPILALRARRSSNLHLRMRPPPSTDLPVMQPRDTAYLSHLQEASHSNVNNNVKSSNMYIESCVNER